MDGHEYWMHQALEMAELAAARGEVPVGAVLVHEGKLIAKAGNQSIELNDPSAHAEIQVLRAAGLVLNNYRLVNTQLYVTLEPCAMCAGAMVHARVSELIYGASDEKTGAAGSVFQIADSEKLNHQMMVQGGVLAAESKALLQSFFRARRKNKQNGESNG